ncbi:TPA: type IV secretion system protein [Raoultella planticola]|jgi:type IV secretion system protein VirB5|uniref:Putative conjugal transfer protein n=1 Tax=Klebsiella michiganensis (strain ATCC 8724 / DSM 4798 / JCM 20051 / NBRC 3318 / NRRL B-199 / KCTC 1686 / BUCSAV 143 / CCM 1901) TaxID=1006551 RepID=A0A0H3HDU2_KLEM8|nr:MULTISPECIES: type IV secretion system protein [Enterobacterales]MBH3047584.1 type IV secretion system protein [Serratia marcescens]HDH7821873.1 type IV secretion system protein [Raoultella planticola]AEX06629.1 putative conjugal transfer protein [Klebsiella michiganensis KCTC 1686]AHY08330.1 Minor pilin of type IV secretion complex (VirB5) [Serratia plymuthica]EJD6309541.1 type IV secretion system protein [Raoultella ornithinolytica]
MRFRDIILALSLFISTQAMSAGIPVFDAVQNTESMNQWIQKLQQWQETVTHYRSELDAYKQQLATATGVRDVQAFLREAKSLKTDIDNLRQNGISLDDLLSNQSGSYSSELNSLYNKYKTFDTCNPSSSSQRYLDSCKQMILNQAVAIENTSEVENKITGTLGDISDLSDRIANAQDSKESQDLANAIAAKSVQLNALTSQWEMSVKQAEQRATLLEQQKQKAFEQQQLTAPVADLNSL